MEIDRVSFAPRLLEMLEDMAKSTFVAIDFEFSGIATKLAHATGRQTVQERYRDTKEAAERYQILQVGLTFAIYDDDTNRYILKPYNMNLSPLVDEKLDIERIFSFQSGAVEFLLRHGFDLHKPFASGVPYLSREEAAKAKELAYNRLSRKNIQDIHIGDEDVEALAFLQALRKAVDKWKEQGYNELEITSRQDLLAPIDSRSEEDGSFESRPGLSRYEKRLVHQLVRAEYNDLVTISGRDSIRIIPLDEQREAEHLRKRKHGVKEQINRQTGFRWIVEALLGNPLHRLDVRSFSIDPQTGVARFVDMRALQSRFDQASASIQYKRVPIVGHNMFTDLVYLYRTFIGPLPDTVECFQAELHKSFPLIIDTKYLATHNCGDINPASSLQEIEESLQLQERPIIDTHQNHSRYVAAGAFHEAGYDSYLTAIVAIRLSAKLEHQGTHANEVLSHPAQDQPASNGLKGVVKGIINRSASLLAPARQVAGPADKASTEVKGQPSAKASARSTFSTANMFERLGMLDLNSDSVSEGDDTREPASEYESHEESTHSETEQPLPPMTEMPPFASDFWKVYANKLRLFGTVEGIVDLNA